jgi:hypothetical protein
MEDVLVCLRDEVLSGLIISDHLNGLFEIPTTLPNKYTLFCYRM